MAKVQVLADRREEVYRKVREYVTGLIPEDFFPMKVEEREIVYADGTRYKLGQFVQMIGKTFKFDPSNDFKRFRDSLEVGMSYDADGLTNLIVTAKVKFLVPDKTRMIPYKEHYSKYDRMQLQRHDNGTATTESNKRKWYNRWM